MTARIVDMDAPDTVRNSGRDLRYAVTRIAVCDGPMDLATLAETMASNSHYRIDSGKWHGMDWSAAMQGVQSGNLARVPQSDKFLSAIEDQVFISPAWRVIDDVVGAVPNVPNYIAGLPCAMRRRVRTASETAPLAIFADVSSSGSVSTRDMIARGAAMLALVRMLANIRPVELWTVSVVGVPHSHNAYGVITRVDTAPLDLARAAHLLCEPAMARRFGYGIGHMLANDEATGWTPWAFDNADLWRKNAREILSAHTGGSESVYFPAVHACDESIQDPVTWLKTMIARFGGTTEE